MDNPGKNQANIYLSDSLAEELEQFAKRETEETGHDTTKTKLTREIFMWGLAMYKHYGSLRKLKRVTAPIALTRDELIDRSLEIDKQVLEDAKRERQRRGKKAG